MPSLAELQTRFPHDRAPYANDRESAVSLAASEEVLIADARGRMTPAQFVEQKLRAVLRRDKPFTVLVTPKFALRRKSK